MNMHETCKRQLKTTDRSVRSQIRLATLALGLLMGMAVSHGSAAGTGTNATPTAPTGAVILTPKPGPTPRINGPLVCGCRPGHPFLYRIPCTGDRPMKFSAKNLPPSLILDGTTGIITGTAPARGEYAVALEAENARGTATRPFRIVAGETLALTPPMGWNSWYVHFSRVTDADIRAAADGMISSGMADAGYQYVNVDDSWAIASSTNRYLNDPKRVGQARDASGNILPNAHFPDMKAMVDYIHAMGLKAGIYSSPGPRTCVGCAGSYQHEAQDARQFANWGFDFLKYDLCSYHGLIKSDSSLEAMQKPYRLMGKLLKQQNRNIVFNLCQYGLDDVWKWGSDVGGNSWRTAGDLGFELKRIFSVALKNTAHGAWSKPGAWNDPDYIQIGWMGSQRGANFTEARPCPLTPDEQYSYMSLWSLMASPLFFSGDMRHLDDFTLNILCNPEVIDVDQDPLGCSAAVVRLAPRSFMMVKPMADGSKAVGLFNEGDKIERVSAPWSAIGISGEHTVRDLWREKDLGTFNDQFSGDVPPHGVVLVLVRSKP